MVVKAGRFSAWLVRILLRDPESLLSLLIESHQRYEDRASVSMAFRAGMKIGLRYPAISRSVIGEAEYEI